MSDEPTDYIDRMLSAIVGIEIEITRIVGKWELGQNREERDRLSAAKESAERGVTVLSAAMQDEKR